MQKRFTKYIEDFVCDTCGHLVKGTGFTNHCPKCLWSKHVDKNPGDRQEECKGMMEPRESELKKGQWRVEHRCLLCNVKKKNRLSPGDDFETLINIYR